MRAGGLWGLLSALVAISLATAVSSVPSINEIFNETQTIAYIILGPDQQRHEMVTNFLHSIQLSPAHYRLYHATDRSLITQKHLNLLKKQHFFDEKWENRYLIDVQPQSRVKNLGKLALILTTHSIFLDFLQQKSFQSLLVFEDDVMVSQRYQQNQTLFLEHLSELLTLPPSHWDLQYLGFCFECGNETSYLPQIYNHLAVKAVFPLCKHAILMSRTFVAVYLSHYRPLQSNKGDWIFHQIACQFHLKVLRPMTSLFSQNLTVAGVESMLGNQNDKREFTKTVSCLREEELCRQMRLPSVIRREGGNHTDPH
jgi:hypothetical protein